jgi:hypothetical protein
MGDALFRRWGRRNTIRRTTGDLTATVRPGRVGTGGGGEDCGQGGHESELAGHRNLSL